MHRARGGGPDGERGGDAGCACGYFVRRSRVRRRHGMGPRGGVPPGPRVQSIQALCLGRRGRRDRGGLPGPMEKRKFSL